MDIGGNTLFFELLRVSVGAAESLSRVYDDGQWAEVFETAKRQSLSGVLSATLDVLPDEQIPSRDLSRKWMMCRAKSTRKNALADERARELTAFFREQGLACCILKGQGVARLYDNPSLRECGDIDIWVSGGRERILDLLKSRVPLSCPVYHHVDARFFEDIPVEVHFTPAWAYNPFTNRKIQSYFDFGKQAPYMYTPEGCGFNVPGGAFQAVFSLLHISKHIINEGVGLRQVMDYYYILRSLTDAERKEVSALLPGLGLSQVAGAVMYIVGELFGLDRSLMLCDPDPRRGAKLFEDVMLSGNFGHYDERGGGLGSRFLRFVAQYPSEVLWSPFWKVWHRVWRMRKGYLKKAKK